MDPVKSEQAEDPPGIVGEKGSATRPFVHFQGTRRGCKPVETPRHASIELNVGGPGCRDPGPFLHPRRGSIVGDAPPREFVRGKQFGDFPVRSVRPGWHRGAHRSETVERLHRVRRQSGGCRPPAPSRSPPVPEWRRSRFPRVPSARPGEAKDPVVVGHLGRGVGRE